MQKHTFLSHFSCIPSFIGYCIVISNCYLLVSRLFFEDSFSWLWQYWELWKLDTIISQKIIIDRANFNKKTYTIQIYYGNFDEATFTLNDFEERFPKIKAEILFETPNYKVRIGRFKSESDASKTLEKLIPHLIFTLTLTKIALQQI